MPFRVLVLTVAVAVGGAGLPPQTGASADRVALVGTWQLDLARTHYGPGVDRRRSEQMRCDVHDRALNCAVEGVRADGRRVTARFTASLAGGNAPVVGVAEIDSVDLRSRDDGLVDATFSYRGKPRYGYRAYRADDGNSLLIVSVDPVTRVALTSLVVYRRSRTAARPVSPNEH